MLFQILVGILPAIPAYFIAHALFMSKKPVVTRTQPSVLTPIIEGYRQRQLEIEGRVAPTVTETAKTDNSDKADKKKETVMQRNHAKWGNTKAQIPLVVQSVKLLETMSAMSALHLSVEEEHNLEVLSSQTDELLTNFFQTPEQIRIMPAVQQALQEQLNEIQEVVVNFTGTGAESVIRNIKTNTAFLKTKFKK